MKFINDSLAKFMQLSKRERVLVLLAAVVALYMVFDAALLTPQQKRIKQLQQSTQAHRTEKDALTAKLTVIQADSAKGAALAQSQREEIAALKQQIASAEGFYSHGGQKGSNLAVLLRELLSANPNISLVNLKTQPTTVFFSPAEQAKNNKAGTVSPDIKNTIYRSGVDVSLKGSYPDLQNYLKSLEKHAGQLFWPGVQLDVANYPQAVLKLSIATLGEDATTSLN